MTDSMAAAQGFNRPIRKDRPEASLWNLPNILTLIRLVLAVFLCAAISFEWWMSGLAIMLVASVTDWLDGYLARLQGLVSSLGRMLDPLVDKVLISGAFIFLLPVATLHGEGWLPPWMVAVVVGRELIITSIRELMERKGVAFGADWPGKLKMALQCVAICLALVAEDARSRDSLLGLTPGTWASLRDIFMWAMALATIGSGLHYLVKLALMRPKTDNSGRA
jgi:CDP-diacylglycerol--glycerol-3-phosphate 3-phosphatidyltransferase